MANHGVTLQFSHFSVVSDSLNIFLQQDTGLLFFLLFTLSIKHVLCWHWGEMYQRRRRTCVSVLYLRISTHITCFIAIALLYPLLNTKRYPDFSVSYPCLNFKADIPKRQEWSADLLYSPKSGQLGKFGGWSRYLARERSALFPAYIEQLQVKLLQSWGHR